MPHLSVLVALLAAPPLLWATVTGLWIDPLWAAAPLVLLLPLAWAGRKLRATERQEQGLVWIAAALGAGLALAASARIPVSIDGEVYLFQARLLARGQLTTDALPQPEFFHYYFLVPTPEGGLGGAFPPGWPAVLSIGAALGVPWLVNPLLVGTLVLLAASLARAAFPTGARGVPLLTAMLVALSPTVTGLGGTMMSHLLAANLTVGALLLGWPTGTQRRWTTVLVGGLLIGALFCVRPLNALLTGVMVLGMTLATRPRLRWGKALAGVAVAAVVGSLYLLYNTQATGSALTPGQDAYFAMTEPNRDCHRLGFGDDVGCTNAHNLDAPGYGAGDAARTTGQRLTDLGKRGLGPGLALLLPLVLAWRRPKGTVWPIAGLAGITLSGYAAFYYHGNFLGPRLLLEAFVPGLVLVAAGALQLRWAGVALALAGLLAGHALIQTESEGHRWMPYAETQKLLSDAPEGPKLIFVDGSLLRDRARWVHYSLGVVLGDVPGGRAKTLFAHDLGPAANQSLIRSYPNHTPFRLVLRDIGEPGAMKRELAPSLAAHPIRRGDRSVVINAVARFPLRERPDCGFAEPAELGNGVHSLRLAVHDDHAGTCRFDLGPAPATANRWRVLVTAARSPGAGSWQLRVGDRPVGAALRLAGAQGSIRRIRLGLISTEPSDRLTLEAEAGGGSADLLELAFLPAQGQ